MTIKVYRDLMQGSPEWLNARRGLLTASEMKHIMTPTGKPANNDKSRAHLHELLAQRISGYVEPTYVNDDMMRGIEDEPDALAIYDENYADVERVGFVTNDRWGFTIGASPDGLVGADGIVEVKSRRQKAQVETILANTAPEEHMAQIQTILLVTERAWCDYISYCAGLPMCTIRVERDEKWQLAIVEAASAFYAHLKNMIAVYENRLEINKARLIPTERKNLEITV